MYVDVNTIITAGSLLTAVVVIFSSAFAVYKWYLRQNEQDKEIERMKSEQCLLTYGKAHIQSKGWVDYGMITKDTIIGTVGEKKRIECLCFEGDFEYRVHIQGSGWTDWTKADGVATLGTVGQELRIEAIQFR